MGDEKKVTLHGYPVEVGDRVWHLQHGWATITDVRTSLNNDLVSIRFDGGFCSTIDIRRSATLFWQPFEITPPPKPEPEIDWTKVPQGTLVEVRDDVNDSWRSRTFLCFSIEKQQHGHFVASDEGYISSWRCCRLAPGVEVKKEWLK